MKTLVSNFYMIDILLWLSLLSGINAQCGSESVGVSNTGQQGHTEYMFVDNTAYTISAQDLSSYFDVNDPTGGTCSTITYSILTAQGAAYTGSDYTVDANEMSIVRTATRTESIKLKATMPGGSNSEITMSFGIVNEGCTYSQSGTTTYTDTINPTVTDSINWKSDFPCQYNSDNTADTDCPLTYIVLYADNSVNTAVASQAWADETFPANTFQAGLTQTINYAVGLRGNPFNQETLVGSSTVCQFTFYVCGNEQIALANQGTETLSLSQGGATDTQVYDPNTVAGYFSVTHTQNQAYTECTVDTYLLQDANGATLTDTTVLSYADATGITVKLANTQTNYVFKLLATTKGGQTITKDFDLTVSASNNNNCGAESIAPASSVQNGYQWGMYASGGQKVDFGATLSSGMFDVTNAASGCETLTYSLFQTDGTTTWSDTKIYISQTTNRIEIDIDAAFGDKQLIMQGTTPGGASATVTLNIMVLNSGCTYSVGQTTADFYFDPTTTNTLDPANSACGWATSNAASTDCPLSYMMTFADAQGSQNGVQQLGAYAANSMPANTMSAGATMTQYVTVGFPAQLPAYLVKSPVCTETFYFCGKETVTAAASSAEAITEAEQGSGTYVLTHANLDALFAVVTTPSDAYAGCVIDTYELVQSDGNTGYTDTTYVSYSATADTQNNIEQGITWKLDAAVANFGDAYIKVTTIGGISATRQFDFTIISCGSEDIAQNAIGQNVIYYGMFADSGKTTVLTSSTMSSYWDITNAADDVCKELTYTLSDFATGSSTFTDSKITLNSDNLLEIDYGTAFAEKSFRLHGTTPGNKLGFNQMKVIVTNSGCTYTLGSTTSQDAYIDITADYVIDPSTRDCQWTSSNSADTDCPISYNLWYTNAQGNSGELGQIADMSSQTINANSVAAGYTFTHYRSQGIPGYSPNGEHIVRGGVCTENYYFCGKETVSLANSGAEEVKKAQDTSSGSGTVYVMDENTLASYFTIDTSASDAYSGCGVQSYALVESDETTAYTDTTYVFYNAGTGISFRIASVTAQQEIYVKMTTIGQITKVKQFSFSVFACGSESIELANVGMSHVESIYATGTANDVYTIPGSDIDSNHFKVTDSTGNCGTITKTLVDASGNAWTNSKISLDGQGNMEIKKETAFAAETFYVKGCTPGSSCTNMEFTIMVTNQGCSYSHSGSTTVNAYADPTADVNYDYSANACAYTSTNTADTDCPLYRIYYTDAAGTSATGVAQKHSTAGSIPANSMSAGTFPGTLYYKVGLPGNPFTQTVLTAASETCTFSLHLCGKETITEQNAGDQVLSYSKGTSSGAHEKVALSTFESWFKVDVSQFTATSGADWSGCKAESYALLQSDGGAAYTDAAKASFDSNANELKIITDTVVTHNIWLQATTVGAKKFSKKIEVKVEAGCTSLTWSYTSTPAMTNTLTVGSNTYKIYEKVINIGASTSTATAAISSDVTFSNNQISTCPVATWTVKSSLTATTSLSSGSASDAATQSVQTNQPKIYDYYYTVSTADSNTDTINYKIAVCGLEKVAVADTSEVKITKYYNEFKKDYNNLKYYAESIYSTWFSLNTATLKSDGLVATAIEADMFKRCPINDYMLCKDEPCEALHSANSLFYFDYQTKAKVTSDGTLQADGKEPAATRRLATAPQIPYTDPSFNITKVTERDANEKYSRIVMKLDTVYSQTAYVAAITTGYAKGVRAITFENKCGLEYIYPQKTAYEYQLQIDNGQYTVQATEYQAWFKNSFTYACPIVKYEIRSYDAEVTVDDKLADGTYLKFTKEYLTAQSVTDPKIPSVAASAQQITNAQGGTSKYVFCHNSLTDEGVACTSTKRGGKRLDEFDFPEDDIMRRVEILSTGQLQIDTDGQTLNDQSNTYQIDLVAISEGGAEAFAHVNIEFIAKRVAANNPPTFASNPSVLTIDKVDDTTVQTYVSPQASDLDGESVTIEVSGNIYSFITIQTTDTNFVITVDHSQITEDLDGKTFSLSVDLSDAKDTTSYTVDGKINWKVVEPEPIPEPEVIEEDVAEVEEEQKVELKEGEVEIGAATAEWQEVASPEVMNQIFAEYKPPPEPANDTEKETFKPVKLDSEANSVSRDGAFQMRFNQLMKVPDFIDTTGQAELGSYRLLAKDEKEDKKEEKSVRNITDTNVTIKTSGKIPLSQLDVERDICSVRFILASEVDPKDIKYFLVIRRWDERGVDILVNFTNPMLVSRGEDRDLVEVSIKRPQLFISKENGQMIDTSELVFYQTIPRQLPKGVSEKSLKDDAADIAAVLNSMAYIQIVLQFMLKGIMADLMVTFYCLQLCCFFTIYKVQIPGNSEIYIDEFRKLIDMDAVKPDNILKQFNEDWSVDYFMNLSKERLNSAAESSGMKSSSFVKNMSTFIFIAGGVVGGVVVMALLTTLRSRFQAMIKEKLNGTLNKMFFNGQIKGMTVSYLKTTIAFSASVQFMDFSGMSTGELWGALGVPSMICLVYPFVCLFVVLKCRAHLAKARFKKRISNMYEGVHLTKNRQTILFYPFYLIRRLIFVCLPLMFWWETTFQVQVLFFVNYAYSIFFFHAQPIADSVKNKMQMYNEGMMILITYHMFYFTDYAEMDKQFTMGYGFVLTLCAILLVNAVKMGHNSFMQSLSARRKAANQKAYEKAYNDWVEFQIAGKANRKQDREKKRLEKLERADKAMKAFKDSALIMNLKKDILKRQQLAKKKEAEAAKKQGGALDQLFSQTGKGQGLDLFAQKPQKKPKRNNPADMLKVSLQKNLDLTKIQEQEGEEGTQRTPKDIYNDKQAAVQTAKNEFDLAFQKMFAKEEDSESEVELTEEEIELNKLIASLSFLDRATYRNNAELMKKYSQMNQQITQKRKETKLSLKETIDILDSINQEHKRILPLEAIHLQQKKMIGDVEPQEHSTHKQTADEQFDIYLTAIQIEVDQIKGQQDRIERRNKVGKYQHLKKEKKKQPQENVIDLDALDQELSQGMPIDQEDDEVNFDIELPDRLKKKRQNKILHDKDQTTGADDLLVGAAIVGAHSAIPLNDQIDRTIRIEDPNEDMEVHEEVSQSKFKHIMAKVKFLGAEGLVFAGILEKEDLPTDPDAEDPEEEEEKVVEEEEDEDEDSASDEEDEDDDGEGGGKKKKKKGVVEEEEEEELPEDY